MADIHVLFKFAPNPYGGIEVDTTSSSGIYRELSPFILGPIRTYLDGVYSQNFENLWQFSKVYKKHLDSLGWPNTDWENWRNQGWRNPRAIRYPMGKGAIPEYSYWGGRKLGYIDARKKIYAPIYAEYVQRTNSFKELQELYNNNEIRELYGDDVPIILRDYDAYDHIEMGMSLVNVINNPGRKMGHAFVLAMMLTGVLDRCLEK